MDNYYDFEVGDWVTDRTRYEAVLAESRFAAIRDGEIADWPPAQAWQLILELLAAVPEDTVQHVGGGPLEDFVRREPTHFLEQVEGAHRTNDRLRDAALQMYLTKGEFSQSTEARLSAALGPRSWLLPGAG